MGARALATDSGELHGMYWSWESANATARHWLETGFVTIPLYAGVERSANAYAEKNTLFDVGLVILFGALGWLMVVTGWPRPPMILGLVLGRLTEPYLFLSVPWRRGSFRLRPQDDSVTQR